MIYLRSILFSIVFYLGTIVLTLGLLPLLVRADTARLAGRLWGRYCVLCCHIAGLSHRLDGDVLADEQVIYAAKHQSAWETLVLYPLLGSPLVVLKQELLRLPVIGWFMSRAGVVPVDRSAGIAALKKLKKSAEQAVQTGRSILIFPQGTRVKAGTARPYQPGVYALYQTTGLKVVPIALNSGMFWGRKAAVKYPGQIVVKFLDPIPPGLSRADFMHRLETEIETNTTQLEAEADDV